MSSFKNFNCIEYNEEVLIVEFESLSSSNSLGLEQSQELLLIRKKYSTKKVLLFYSNNERFFCTGGNLKFYASLNSKKEGVLANKKIRDNIQKFCDWKIIKIAAVDGDCLGGGLEFLLGFNFIFSSAKSMFGLWQRRLGLTFGWGGRRRSSKRLSGALVEKLSLESRLISTFEAQSLGLIDRIFPQVILKDRALDFALRQAQLPAYPVQSILDSRDNLEVSFFNKLWLNPAHLTYLSKFLIKK